MSKKIFALVILVMMLFAMGCDGFNKENGNNNDNNTVSGGSSVEEKNSDGEFVFKGKVTSIENKYHIEMEIIDSEIAFGTYWVNVGDHTEYVRENGEKITRKDINVGDTIEVVFSGQVMMSYPPQISAQKIIVK